MMNELEALWMAYEACADEKEKEAIMEAINATMEYFDDFSRDSGAFDG